MSDIVRILGIARRAMYAHQAVMNTTGNNIANVNTEGYSRQRASIAETPSLKTSNGFLGSGVTLQTVERIRDTLVDQQLLSERPSFEQYQFKNESLQFIEDIFNEPSDFGVNRNLEDFFNSFQDLANDPESSAARTVVRQRAVSLTSSFNRIERQLSTYQDQLNSELSDTVSEINNITTEIAKLNERIVEQEVSGHQAPGLRDQRDLLVDDLSKLVDVRTTENAFGGIAVSVASRTLVVDTQVDLLSLTPQSAADPGPAVTMERDGTAISVTNGKLKGILDIRDNNIPNYISQLDEFVTSFTTAVNAVHSTGYNLTDDTGTNLFDPNTTGADDFAVSPEVLNDANLIATSDTISEPGNNATVLSILDLQDSLEMNDGQFTFSDFYNSLISSVGSETQEAGFLEESFTLTVEHLEFKRESVSGVSLDEEMTKMIESQQAYTAAARVITNVDEMAQTVLNMV